MYKSQHKITLRHYLVLSVTAFAAGIYSAAVLPSKVLCPLLVLLGVVFIMLGIVLLTFLILNRKIRIKPILLPLWLILCIFLGTARLTLAELSHSQTLSDYSGKSIWLSGVVATAPSTTSSGISYVFEFDVYRIGDKNIAPKTIVLYIPARQGEALQKGSKICCWTTLNTPSRKDQFDNYDYYTHLRGKNIFLVGNTQNINFADFETDKSLVSFIKRSGNFVKDKITYAIDRLLYDSPKYAAILKGILVGDKAGFSDNLYKKFSYAGLSHIVAVSGMHLSILFSLITLLFCNVSANRKAAFLLCLPLLLLFVSAAGFTPSVCRAAIMLFVMITANLFHQRYSPLTAIFISLAVILLAAPYSLFSKSLTLSFGATFCILLYFSYLQNLFDFKVTLPQNFPQGLSSALKKSVDFVSGSLALSFSAFCGTAYFCALFFKNISLIQFLTNLWAIPAVTIVFSLGIIGCISFYIFPHLSIAVFYYPLRIFLYIIYKTADVFGRKEFALSFSKDSLSPITFIIYLGILVFIYLLLKTLSDIKKEKSDRIGSLKN